MAMSLKSCAVHTLNPKSYRVFVALGSLATSMIDMRSWVSAVRVAHTAIAGATL